MTSAHSKIMSRPGWILGLVKMVKRRTGLVKMGLQSRVSDKDLICYDKVGILAKIDVYQRSTNCINQVNVRSIQAPLALSDIGRYKSAKFT